MRFKDLSIGQKFSLSKTITSDDVEGFAHISGDFNPIHLDENYAAKTFFKKRIVHGMIIGSFFSKAIASDLPGEGSIYLNQNMNFLKPVYHNQKVEIVISISDLKQEKKIVLLNTQCFVEGVLAVDGTAVVKKIF